MRFIGIIIFSILVFFHQPSFSRINDKRVYDNVYKACIKKPGQFNSREARTYCSCFASEIMEGFTVKELMELEAGLLVAKDEETKIRIAISNNKINKMTIKCASKIIN